MCALGQPFIILDTIGSTNNYAMGQVHAQMTKHGTAYFAREQTTGKGQRNKTWDSTPGQNIILSLVVQPEGLRVQQSFAWSAAVALACLDFFTVYAGEETSIKWPNDLYWRDRKAGGILIENLIRGTEWSYSVAGIGININQTDFPPEVRNGVSLKQITGRDFDCVALAKELCSAIGNRYDALRSGHVESLLLSYLDHLYRKNEIVRLKQGSRVFEAMLLDVTNEGKLRVKAGDLIEEFAVGEIEFVM